MNRYPEAAEVPSSAAQEVDLSRIGSECCLVAIDDQTADSGAMRKFSSPNHRSEIFQPVLC